MASLAAATTTTVPALFYFPPRGLRHFAARLRHRPSSSSKTASRRRLRRAPISDLSQNPFGPHFGSILAPPGSPLEPKRRVPTRPKSAPKRPRSRRRPPKTAQEPHEGPRWPQDAPPRAGQCSPAPARGAQVAPGRPSPCRLRRHRCHDAHDPSAWPRALWCEPGGARAPAFRA